MSDTCIEFNDVLAGYGEFMILNNLSFKAKRGKITLLLRPKVLLIDEPSIGLSPMAVQDVFKLLRKLADKGTTVLMVEQNVKSALKMADEAIALESGRLVLHKRADELLADPNIERLFLGGAHQAAAPAGGVAAA